MTYHKRGEKGLNIRDIAALSGVSVATVSRVINNNPSVTVKTREMVLSVIQQNDYVPNAFASGFGRNSMKIVGILCTDVANLYYANALSLLEHGLRRYGFDTLLYCTGTLLTDKKGAITALLQRRVDAIFLIGSAYREERDNQHIREAAQQTPIFFINAYIQLPNVYCVYCDEKEAIFNTVKQLVSAGIKDILYLHDMQKWAWAGSQKLAGYKEGLAACGIKENPDLIQVVDYGINTVRNRVTKILAKLDEGSKFNGILASEDVLAIGAQKAVLSQKKNMDISIIGFNNSQLALCCTPALTSVDNMLDTICPMAVNMLNQLFKGEKISSKVVVSATLVERETFRIDKNSHVSKIED
ncbi:MAG: LacI family transcriptional regulator [Clostridiales bacterium]|nr:LacI family transcriptional regulator [Clostridiales bacterium]